VIVRHRRDEDSGSCLGKEVSSVDGYAGDFSLATPVEGHPAGTLVQVTVPARHPSRLVLDFSDHQALMDARVLGHIGVLELLELGLHRPARQAASAGSVRAPESFLRTLTPRALRRN
jgi:hypothetical protein